MGFARHRRWIAFVILPALLPAAGCGNTGAQNAGLATSALKASDARLRIERPNHYVAAANSASVKVDGREVASMGIGGSTMLDVAAGQHKITVAGWGHPNAYTIELDAKPGMLYTLHISPRIEAFAAAMAFGFIGQAAEAGKNENGGTFEINVVEETPIRR